MDRTLKSAHTRATPDTILGPRGSPAQRLARFWVVPADTGQDVDAGHRLVMPVFLTMELTERGNLILRVGGEGLAASPAGQAEGHVRSYGLDAEWLARTILASLELAPALLMARPTLIET